MAYQKLFKTGYIEDLKSALTEQDVMKTYTADSFNYDSSAILDNPRIKIDEPIRLNLPTDKDHFDFENSKIIFECYKELNPVMATDSRMWTYLAHVDYWEYMRGRWPLEDLTPKFEEKPADYVLEHWFLKSPAPTWLMRNGISRLWWVSYLTYDENRDDPYELTQEAFSMLDYTRHLLTETQGRYRDFRHAILEFVINNKELFSKYKEARVRFLMRKVNYLGGYKIYGNLSKKELEQIFLNYKTELDTITSTDSGN